MRGSSGRLPPVGALGPPMRRIFRPLIGCWHGTIALVLDVRGRWRLHRGDPAGAARLFEAAARAVPRRVRPVARADAGLPPAPGSRARASHAGAGPRSVPRPVRTGGARAIRAEGFDLASLSDGVDRGARAPPPTRRAPSVSTLVVTTPGRAPGARPAAVRRLPRSRRVHAVPVHAADHRRPRSRRPTGTPSSTICRTADAARSRGGDRSGPGTFRGDGGRHPLGRNSPSGHVPARRDGGTVPRWERRSNRARRPPFPSAATSGPGDVADRSPWVGASRPEESSDELAIHGAGGIGLWLALVLAMPMVAPVGRAGDPDPSADAVRGRPGRWRPPPRG